MKKVITKGRISIKLWLDDIEHEALEQALHLAELPFAHKHVAIMPDAHCGYGMPIGGVIALEDVIIPNAVGVDIGCGVRALKTQFRNIDRESLKRIYEQIRRTIPLGRNHHQEPKDSWMLPPCHSSGIINNEFASARKQLGTLGGGNHFIEIQKGSDGLIWIMIHSGSRNVGKKVADYWNNIATKLNEKWSSSIPPSWKLAFLPLSSDQGRGYWTDMDWCVNFAYENRRSMMDKVVQIVADEMKFPKKDIGLNYIDIAHNYASIEKHFGKTLVVHRKGATKAEKDQLGIIPGSQGTESYIVEGLGNPISFKSCSHGAGRSLSRSKARSTLNLNVEIEHMNRKGIIHSMTGQSDLDEASPAYKDIDEVMENQKDLVKIVTKLTPLAVVKG